MSKILVGAVLLLVLAGCGKSDNATEAKTATATAPVGQSSAAKPPEGPILGLMVAGSIDAKGNLVGQTFTFPPDQPQITVVARIGKVAEGSSIRFVWYQETDDEDKALFDQTVKVASFDRAYSEGKNPGALAVGRYKVIATLDGKTSEIEFAVATRSTKSAPRSASSMKFDWLSLFGVQAASAQGVSSTTTSNQAPQTAPSGPPAAGASGADECCDVGGNGVPTEILGEDGLKLHDGSIDHTAPFLDFIVRGSKSFHLWYLTMTVNNKSFEEHNPYASETQNEMHYYITPCNYWGSDLPGARISVVAMYPPINQDAVSLSGVITLGNDTLAPSLHVDSIPPKNTKVKAGQKIDITVTATEARWKTGPWQTGVRWIQVTSPEGLVGDPWTNPSRLPQACDKKTWEQVYKTTYLIPNKPPLMIMLCAVTQDYADNENSKCATFPTGDVWSGTWHQDSNRSYRNFTTGAEVMKCDDTWDGTVSFAVGADGVLEGTAVAKLTSGFRCTPDQGRSSVERVREIAYTVSGQKTATGFELHLKFDHNTPKGVNWGGNMLLLGRDACQATDLHPPSILIDHGAADNVANGRFTATGSPFCGGSKSDVAAVDAHLEVTRQ